MALWTPADITTALWLDASDSGTITIDTGVSQWADKSGNARHAAQASTSLQPVYDAGNDLIDFTTGNHILISSYQININNVAIISVASTAFIFRREGTDGRFYYGYNRLRKGAIDNTLAGVTGDFAVCYAESFSNSFTVISNGGQASNTASDTNNATLDNLSIGGGNQLSINSSTIDYYVNTKVKEVVIFDGIPTTETRQKAEGYLAWKWGLESTLPSGHPYEDFAPVAGDFHAIPAESLTWTPQTPVITPVLPAESLTWTGQPFTQSGNVIQAFLPAESLTWAVVDPFATPILPAATLAWTPQTPVNAFAVIIPAESLTWTAQAPTSLLSTTLPAATLVWTAQRPQQTYDAPSFAVSRAVYRCYLTGDAEDPVVADLELPLASFQSRRRNGEQTYLAITVPNPVPYITEINNRLNGDIVIYSGFAIGDVETLTELLRVNFGTFRYDLGARSGSASLSGHKQVTYSNPKTRALSGISYRSVTDGITLVRCEPDMWLNPGDTADTGDGAIVVDTISYTIKPTLATMEVKEVETEVV